MYVAAVLAGVMRKSLPTCPAFILDAPQASSGKSKLGFVIQEIATGRQNAIVVKENDRAELAKQIDSELLAGMPAIFLDNVSQGSKIGAQLDGLLTSPVYRFRPLGKSITAEVSTRTLILVSSNNFVPAADMWRRILTIRLDAKTDKPELRKFPFVPEVEARKERQNIVAAALFILKSFRDAGCPQATSNQMASYEAFRQVD